jgi:hypothetical protein
VAKGKDFTAVLLWLAPELLSGAKKMMLVEVSLKKHKPTSRCGTPCRNHHERNDHYRCNRGLNFGGESTGACSSPRPELAGRKARGNDAS